MLRGSWLSHVPSSCAPSLLGQLSVISDADFVQKQQWFRETMRGLRGDGRIVLRVRREHLLRDALRGFEIWHKHASGEFSKPLEFVFVGEEGVDAGGVAREFYHEVSRALFNVDAGLFAFAGTDACTYQINPWSGAAAEDHLAYFRFAGLLMGKALLDGHHLDAV